MHVVLGSVSLADLGAVATGESSASIRRRVASARTLQMSRLHAFAESLATRTLQGDGLTRVQTYITMREQCYRIRPERCRYRPASIIVSSRWRGRSRISMSLFYRQPPCRRGYPLQAGCADGLIGPRNLIVMSVVAPPRRRLVSRADERRPINLKALKSFGRPLSLKAHASLDSLDWLSGCDGSLDLCQLETVSIATTSVLRIAWIGT
jgi:hypothetical protein